MRITDTPSALILAPEQDAFPFTLSLDTIAHKDSFPLPSIFRRRERLTHGLAPHIMWLQNERKKVCLHARSCALCNSSPKEREKKENSRGSKKDKKRMIVQVR